MLLAAVDEGMVELGGRLEVDCTKLRELNGEEFCVLLAIAVGVTVDPGEMTEIEDGEEGCPEIVVHFVVVE